MRRENISKRIQFIRSIKGISREKLADATELSVSYLYQVESGMKNIGLSALIKVAEALNVSIDELVSEEKEITAEDECQILLKDLTSDCSEHEVKIIIEHARNFKKSLRKYIEGLS